MSNNKQINVVDWLQSIELERDLILADWNKAKAMFEVAVRIAFYDGQRYEENKSSRDYFNEKFGGNNEQQ